MCVWLPKQTHRCTCCSTRWGVGSVHAAEVYPHSLAAAAEVPAQRRACRNSPEAPDSQWLLIPNMPTHLHPDFVRLAAGVKHAQQAAQQVVALGGKFDRRQGIGGAAGRPQAHVGLFVKLGEQHARSRQQQRRNARVCLS